MRLEGGRHVKATRVHPYICSIPTEQQPKDRGSLPSGSTSGAAARAPTHPAPAAGTPPARRKLTRRRLRRRSVRPAPTKIKGSCSSAGGRQTGCHVGQGNGRMCTVRHIGEKHSSTVHRPSSSSVQPSQQVLRRPLGRKKDTSRHKQRCPPSSCTHPRPSPRCSLSGSTSLCPCPVVLKGTAGGAVGQQAHGGAEEEGRRLQRAARLRQGGRAVGCEEGGEREGSKGGVAGEDRAPPGGFFLLRSLPCPACHRACLHAGPPPQGAPPPHPSQCHIVGDKGDGPVLDKRKGGHHKLGDGQQEAAGRGVAEVRDV